MFSGFGLKGLDGTAWYHPQRLTIDSGAVAAGNANPAQEDSRRPRDARPRPAAQAPIYAFGAALGGSGCSTRRGCSPTQSRHPGGQPVLIDRHETYAHNDPNSAFPRNDFIDGLVRFLAKIKRGR